MAPSPSNTDEFLSIGEAAQLLKVSIGTLRRWDRIGHLIPIRLHPRSPRRYRRSDIEALLDTDASA
jgi:excisionase family DNA binding protein